MIKNILIVEYDIKTIDTIKETFLYPIFHFDVVEDGLKAKEILASTDYDLVISAAMLPKFHGFQLSEFISKEYPNTKIIIMSGIYKGAEYRRQALSQFKANDFFEKPLDKDVLKERVFDLLEVDIEDLGKPETDFDSKSMIDTAKVPTLKELEEEEAKLTSDDIFGDIIKDVEQSSAKNDILADDNSPKDNNVAKKEPNLSQTKKIDLSALDNLIKHTDKKKVVKKKIEDEISKKLEDTLSGLGLNSNRPKTKKKVISATTQNIDNQENEEKKKDKKTEDKYDILGLIARGGMAEIYKAKKRGVKGFKKIIALKKILSGYGEDDKFIEMFVDEARIAAELSHPNIVQIYDFEKRDDTYLIAMEFVHGKDLRNILKKANEENIIIPEELSLYIIKNILDALSYAHSAKDEAGNSLDIVHRDVSPPNILISYSGEVKLTDFGVSKAANKMHQTISGALKGKLLYMAPEQAKGERNIDWRADLYSVGVILFELLTGKKLFIDNSEMAVLKKVQEGIEIDFDKFDNIDSELRKIITKSLAKTREDRYQSANDMIADINEYIANTFSPLPTPIHLSHFIYNLFSKEILAQSLKIELKPIPSKIKRIVKEIPEPTPDMVDVPDDMSAFEVDDSVKDETELIELGTPIVGIDDGIEDNGESEEIKTNDDFSPAIDINLSLNEEIKIEDNEKEKEPTITLDEIEQKLKNQNIEAEPNLPDIIENFEPNVTKTKSSKKILIPISALVIIALIYILFTLGVFSNEKDKEKGPSIVSQTDLNIIDKIAYKKGNKTPFTGFVESKWNNAARSIKEKTEYTDGLKNGSYKSYYDNNSINEEGSYLNGKKIGLWVLNSKDGKKMSETRYSNGKKNGKEVIKNIDGNVVSNKVYKNGKEISGKVYTYYSGTDKIKREITYKDGRIVNEKMWSANGDRIIIANITNKFRQNKLKIGKRTKIYFELNDDEFKKIAKGTVGEVILTESNEILFSVKVTDSDKNIANVYNIKDNKRAIKIENGKITLRFIIPKKLPVKENNTLKNNVSNIDNTNESKNITNDNKKQIDMNKKDELKKEEEKKRLKEEADKKRKADEAKKKQDAKLAEAKRLEEEKAKLAEEERQKQEKIDAEKKRIEQEKLLKKKEEEQKRNALKVGDLVTDVDSAPIPVSVTNPTLSRKLRKKMKTDTIQIVVSLLIDENGKVIKVKRIKKSGVPEIDLEVSRIIVSEWKFKPAIKYNKRVKTWFTKQIILKK